MSHRPIQSSRKTNLHIFFKFKKEILINGSLPISIDVLSDGKIMTKKNITLVGPYK